MRGGEEIGEGEGRRGDRGRGGEERREGGGIGR